MKYTHRSAIAFVPVGFQQQSWSAAAQQHLLLLLLQRGVPNLKPQHICRNDSLLNHPPQTPSSEKNIHNLSRKFLWMIWFSMTFQIEIFQVSAAGSLSSAHCLPRLRACVPPHQMDGFCQYCDNVKITTAACNLPMLGSVRKFGQLVLWTSQYYCRRISDPVFVRTTTLQDPVERKWN